MITIQPTDKSTLYRILFVLLGITINLPTLAKNIEVNEKIYYIDSKSGNDSANGNSPESAWKTLKKAGTIHFHAGDKLFLRRGSVFSETLKVSVSGSKYKPVIIEDYGTKTDTALPKIDAKGYLAAVEIRNGLNFIVRNLELTSDGGDPDSQEAKTERYGVLVIADSIGTYPGIQLENLKIHDIFASSSVKHEGQNPTSNLGMGIAILMKKKDAQIKNVTIKNCTIQQTGFTGIRIFGFGDRTQNVSLDTVSILNNTLINIGGPGMVPGRCRNLLVEGNIVDHSGSSADTRMHMRGSGIWPWSCTDVIIQKNKFMHARGKNDSCGAHIDFNCKNVVVQYNLTSDNEGGFVEILGNNQNCVYRYNISINDGARVKGRNGAQLDGRILWFSGFVGDGNKKTGPFNSYIYNNTIFVKKDIQPCLYFSNTASGILIANNIFYTETEMIEVENDQGYLEYDGNKMLSNVIINNNLFLKSNALPESIQKFEQMSIAGNPEFRNPGGINAQDYIPSNEGIIKDKAINISKLPGDFAKVFYELSVKHDFMGNPVSGTPDLGAIEIQ